MLEQTAPRHIARRVVVRLVCHGRPPQKIFDALEIDLGFRNARAAGTNAAL
jgi:hypothetical protein